MYVIKITFFSCFKYQFLFTKTAPSEKIIFCTYTWILSDNELIKFFNTKKSLRRPNVLYLRCCFMIYVFICRDLSTNTPKISLLLKRSRHRLFYRDYIITELTFFNIFLTCSSLCIWKLSQYLKGVSHVLFRLSSFNRCRTRPFILLRQLYVYIVSISYSNS